MLGTHAAECTPVRGMPDGTAAAPTLRGVEDHTTLLVRISGRDRPGITAGLLAVLARTGAQVFDMEQVVVRERLTLDVLIDVPAGRDVLKELLFFGWESDLQVDFEVVEDARPSPSPPRYAVTVIGQTLRPDQLAAVAGAIAGGGGNIDRIHRLSRYPVVSYELVIAGGDPDHMRAELLTTAASHQLDVAIQPEGLGRRAKRLVVIDVDSTLIQDEVIDLLAEEAGCTEQVRAITRAAMAGELDFGAALRARVELLAGLDASAFDRVIDRVRLTPGARTFVRTLKRLGFRLVIVSGGFQPVADALRQRLGFDHAYANTLEVVDGRLTGRLAGPVVDRARKAELLEEVAEAEGVPLEQTVAIGDGANDLDMLARAGLGIAFNAMPVVQEAADTSVSVPYLDAILFLLGIRRDEVEAADAADPRVPPAAHVPVPGVPPV